MSNPTRIHFTALLQVLEAARANLAPCSTGGYLGIPPCGKPAVWTFGSPNVTLCRDDGREHEGRHDLWAHPQVPLVAAIASFDAIEGALPGPTATDLEEMG